MNSGPNHTALLHVQLQKCLAGLVCVCVCVCMRTHVCKGGGGREEGGECTLMSVCVCVCVCMFLSELCERVMGLMHSHQNIYILVKWAGGDPQTLNEYHISPASNHRSYDYSTGVVIFIGCLFSSVFIISVTITIILYIQKLLKDYWLTTYHRV